MWQVADSDDQQCDFRYKILSISDQEEFTILFLIFLSLEVIYSILMTILRPETMSDRNATY